MVSVPRIAPACGTCTTLPEANQTPMYVAMQPPSCCLHVLTLHASCLLLVWPSADLLLLLLALLCCCPAGVCRPEL
jgi:hypothetical protein